MTISNKSLTVLVGLTLVLLVTTIVVMTHKSSPASTFEKDSLLIQGLDLPLISQIKIAAEGKHVTLAKQDEQFVVADRENYPAATKEINGLLLKVLEIRRHELVSDSAVAHKELGVLDDGKTTKVELVGKDGKSLACVLVAGSAKSGGNYVRLKGENAVYATKEGLWGITAEASSYLRTHLIDTPRDDIVSVTVATLAGTYKIARDAEGKPQLQAVPAGKRVKQASDVEDVFGALTSLDLEDATRNANGIAWTGSYTCKLKNLSYVLRVGKRADKQYIAAQAVGPAQEELEKLTISPNESKLELAKKDALLKANQAATVFNAHHKDWFYQLSELKAKSLSRQIMDLVEDIPPATKPATATAPATPVTKPKSLSK